MEIPLDTLMDELTVFRHAYLDSIDEVRKIDGDDGLKAELEKIKKYVQPDLRDAQSIATPAIFFVELPILWSGAYNKAAHCIKVTSKCNEEDGTKPWTQVYGVIAHEAVHAWDSDLKWTRPLDFSKETMAELYSWEICSRLAFDGDVNYESSICRNMASSLCELAYFESKKSNKTDWLIDAVAPLYPGYSDFRKHLEDCCEFYTLERQVEYLEQPYSFIKSAMKRPDAGILNGKGEFMFGIPNLVKFWNRTMERYGNPA